MKSIQWFGLLLASTALAGAHAQSIQPAPDKFGSVLTPAVVATGGDVVVAGDRITLTKTPGGADPTVLLDYGREVGGVPQVTVGAIGGQPRLQAIYSESRQFLLPAGDGAPAVPNAPALGSRTDVWLPDHAGVLAAPQIQGGERFEQISLTAPGSITLAGYGIKSLTADPLNNVNTGHFSSSDPRLDQIWTLGARTLQLVEVPAHSVLPLMKITAEGAEVAGTSAIQYQFGNLWHDYSQTIDVKIRANQAGLLVRGIYYVTLDAADDRLGTPNQVSVVLSGFFGAPQTIAQVALKTPLTAGVWHKVKIIALGAQAELDIDGAKILSFAAGQKTPIPNIGGVGMLNDSGADAVYRNLAVWDAAGKTLYASPLTEAGVLDQFAADINELPVILDGAKRDRMIWLGDLGQAAPTVYYTSGESQYVKGSLQSFGNFLSPEGEVSGFVTPNLPLSLTSPTGTPSGAGYYSLSYSIYFVNVLHDYLLYTGDRAFALQEWPVVLKDLSYLAKHTGADGLLVTDPADGMDWALDDVPGEVTEYNALYVMALHNAAGMARSLGKPGDAALDALAGRVASRVEGLLYNPVTGVYDQSAGHRGTIAQDANVMAVLAGIAAPGKTAGILEKTDAALMTAHGPLAFSDGSGITALVSPFMTGYETDAHFAIGDAAGALKIILEVWGNMVPGTPYYSGAVQETFGTDGITPQQTTRSLAHGWSTGATSALSEYVLGVRPLSPGYASWIMQPQLGDLSWASGDVPTPHGPISAAWMRKGGTLTADVVAGGGTGTIALPVAEIVSVTLNGKKFAVQARTMDGDMAISGLAPGSYHIEATLR